VGARREGGKEIARVRKMLRMQSRNEADRLPTQSCLITGCAFGLNVSLRLIPKKQHHWQN
jgi:hypothetical protein